MRIIKEEEPNIVNQEFNLRCKIELSTRQTLSDALQGRLSKIESVTVEHIRTI